MKTTRKLADFTSASAWRLADDSSHLTMPDTQFPTRAGPGRRWTRDIAYPCCLSARSDPAAPRHGGCVLVESIVMRSSQELATDVPKGC